MAVICDFSQRNDAEEFLGVFHGEMKFSTFSNDGSKSCPSWSCMYTCSHETWGVRIPRGLIVGSTTLY